MKQIGRKGGRPTINVFNSVFELNRATSSSGRGGAIYADGTLFVSGSTFFNNSLPSTTLGNNVGGGAIFQSGYDSAYNMTIVDSSFTLNRVPLSFGGAIGARSFVSLTRVTFDQNSANTGPAFYARDGMNSLSMNDITFTNNTATASGSAIFVCDSISNVLNQLTFQNNIATSSGSLISFSKSTYDK